LKHDIAALTGKAHEAAAIILFPPGRPDDGATGHSIMGSACTGESADRPEAPHGAMHCLRIPTGRL
jgi:hypothetical protein